jgi:hypothetical protein
MKKVQALIFEKNLNSPSKGLFEQRHQQGECDKNTLPSFDTFSSLFVTGVLQHSGNPLDY